MPVRLIRRAGPEDAAAVRALTRAAYAKWVPLIGREPLPMAADYAAAAHNHAIDLLLVDAALAGLVEMVLRPDDLLVENLAVDPAWQGRGLGGDLLAHAEDIAMGAGYALVRLYTNALFATNLAFYARRGYVVERREPFLGGAVVHLVKRLDSRSPRPGR